MKVKVAQKTTKDAAKRSGSSDRPRCSSGYGHAVDSILRMQRTAGNQFVQRWAASGAAAKSFGGLKVNEPGDAFEREADRVADMVVGGESANPPLSSSPVAVQRDVPSGPEPTGQDRPIPALHTADIPGKVDRSEDEAGSAQPSAVQRKESNTPGSPATASELVNGVVTGGGGAQLSDSTREYMESRFGHDFSNVRIHTDSTAAKSADSVSAVAYTVGNNIVFANGRYAPESRAGQRLLAHELAHVVQQGATTSPGGHPPAVQRQDASPDTAQSAGSKITRVILFKNSSKIILIVEGNRSIQTKATYNGQPNPGIYTVRRVGDSEMELVEAAAAGGKPGRDGKLVRWNLAGATTVGVDEYTFEVIGGNGTAPADDVDSAPLGGANSGRGHGSTGSGGGTTTKSGGDAGSRGKGGGPGGETSKAGDQGQTDGAIGATNQPGKTTPPGSAPGGGGALSVEEQRRWDELTKLMTGATKQIQQDPAELLQLYQTLREKVEHPQFSATTGDPWTDFSRFLQKNKGKIDGIMKGKPSGYLNQEKLEKIIAEYGKFIVAEPAEESRELETLEDFNKHFQYDPGWQKLSKADRKLLLDFARMSPESIEKGNVDFTKVTGAMKVTMALKLSDSWPGEVAEAAKAAFTDPAFIITLVLTIGIYVGLWMTPDPSFVTKLAAGTLTVVMLAQFAWEDIYGLAKAWFDLQQECDASSDVGELKKAGNRFARKVGSVGFDILMFIATWGLGKAVGPKLGKIGARRGVVRAKAGVAAAEAAPGAGTPKSVGPKAVEVVEGAKARAKGTTPTAVLDALGESLPDAAKEGLGKFRQKVGDAQALKAVESTAKAGNEVGRFLSEQAVPENVRTAARSNLAKAEGKLARAKLVEAETIKDPALRQAAKEAARARYVDSMKSILAKLGILDEPNVKRALDSRQLNDVVGALGEAISRNQLNAKYPPSEGYQTANVVIARLLRGFRSIAEWRISERAKAQAANPKVDAVQIEEQLSERAKRLYERDGKLYLGIGEIDTLVSKATADAKLNPVELAETKTGRNDSPSKAMAQVDKAQAGLEQAAAGDADVKLFDRVGKNGLGAERTSDFDLSNINSVNKVTRGPAGKGFNEDLGYDVEQLQWVAESLVQNLPPAKPAVIPPIVSPESKPEKDKEKVQ